MHHKASTLHDKENRLRRDVLPRLGDKPIDQIGVADKDKLASSLKERGLKASTINNSLGALGSILRYAEEIEVIESAPASRFLKVPEAKFDFYTFEEYDRILAVAPDVRSPERLARVLVSGDAGLRLGEARALKWEDIDFVAGHLTVNHAYWRKVIGPPKQFSRGSDHLMAVSKFDSHATGSRPRPSDRAFFGWQTGTLPVQ